MRHFAACVAVAATSATAFAQPFYARGDFNAWGLANQMTLVGPDHYTTTITGLTAGDMPEYKIADETWSQSWPGSNGRVAVSGTGTITFHLYTTTTWSDGWMPNSSARVGYDDSGMHGWDIMGSFNGWSGPAVVLSPMGAGLYSGQLAVPTAGSYEFKFRKEGDWAISIGDDFGNAAANIAVTTLNDNDIVLFDLDLPNGRWRTRIIPTPGSLAFLALAGLFARRRR